MHLTVPVFLRRKHIDTSRAQGESNSARHMCIHVEGDIHEPFIR